MPTILDEIQDHEESLQLVTPAKKKPAMTQEYLLDGAKIILDLCGTTGAWSKPYADAGYDVRIIDLPEDVRLIEKFSSAYGILAAPPCTKFASSGARWARTEEEMIEALSIVDACLRAVVIYEPHFWVLENPVGKLSRYLGKPKMYFHPWEYGDPYTKKTCLWGKFNIPVRNPVEPTQGSKMHVTLKELAWKTGEERQRMRAITPAGFAQAFFEANR